MSTLAPIDLSDDIAVRNYLQTLTTPGGGIINSNIVPSAGQVTATQKLISSEELAKIVKDRVKEFELEFNAVVNKVKYDLEQLIPDYTTIVKSVENSFSIGDSSLRSSIIDSTTLAIDESGQFATALALAALETNVENNYSTTSVINSTYATQTEVGAIYEVAVEANGTISGYRSVANGTSSVFQIWAEKFAITDSGEDEGFQPFQVDTVNRKINMTSDVAIDGNLIINGTVTADQIAANTITGAKIAANTITGAKIAANTITALQIAANTITGDKIAANTITATQLDVANVKASSLFVDNTITSSDFTTVGGAGFRLKANAADTNADPTIYGAYIRGGTIDGTTINASTINIRALNLVNDASKDIDVLFSTLWTGSTPSTGTMVYTSGVYSYNSTSTSKNRFLSNTTASTLSFLPMSSSIDANSGLITIANWLGTGVPSVTVKCGASTVASKTSLWTSGSNYAIGGITFRYTLSSGYGYLQMATNNSVVSASNTSSSAVYSITITVPNVTNFQFAFGSIGSMVLNL